MTNSVGFRKECPNVKGIFYAFVIDLWYDNFINIAPVDNISQKKQKFTSERYPTELAIRFKLIVDCTSNLWFYIYQF